MTYRGQVISYIPPRRFGFLQTADGAEFFFHASHYQGQPVLGQEVEFEAAPPVRLGKSPMAIKIVPVVAS